MASMSLAERIQVLREIMTPEQIAAVLHMPAVDVADVALRSEGSSAVIGGSPPDMAVWEADSVPVPALGAGDVSDPFVDAPYTDGNHWFSYYQSAPTYGVQSNRPVIQRAGVYRIRHTFLLVINAPDTQAGTLGPAGFAVAHTPVVDGGYSLEVYESFQFPLRLKDAAPDATGDYWLQGAYEAIVWIEADGFYPISAGLNWPVEWGPPVIGSSSANQVRVIALREGDFFPGEFGP